MMAEDVLKYFPKVCGNEVSIHVVQSRDHILNTYSEKISQYAEKRFARNDVKIIMNARCVSYHTETFSEPVRGT